MRRSVDGVLTTHTGGLPRPERLTRLVWASASSADIGRPELRRDIAHLQSATGSFLDVARMKLGAIGEGARLASEQLWP
jgi:hypothetical protein